MRKLNFKRENGASLVEYSLLIALVAVMGVASMEQVGSNASDQFEYLANHIGDGGFTPPAGLFNRSGESGCSAGVNGCLNPPPAKN